MKTLFLVVISAVSMLTACGTTTHVSKNNDPIMAVVNYKEAHGVTPDEVGMAAINAGGTGEVVEGTQSDVSGMTVLTPSVYCCTAAGDAVSVVTK